MTTAKFAEDRSGFLTIEAVKDMSGLDYMRRMLAGTVPSMTIARASNFRVSRVDEGLVEVTGTPLHAHTNSFGGVHGGWYGTILDSCMTAAVITALPRGTFQTTIEYKVNLIRAIPVGTEIIGTGRLDHLGRSTGVARGEIRAAADGRLYATGTATCIVMGTAA